MPNDLPADERDAGPIEAGRSGAAGGGKRGAARAAGHAGGQRQRAGHARRRARLGRRGMRAGRWLSSARSLFWRLTAPLRVAVDLARGAPETGSPAGGAGPPLRRARCAARGCGRRWRRRAAGCASPAPRAAQARAERPARRSCRAAGVPARRRRAPPPRIARAGVLIIAELSVPQCAKYRVWQKQEHFTRLGVPCRVVDWRD